MTIQFMCYVSVLKHVILMRTTVITRLENQTFKLFFRHPSHIYWHLTHFFQAHEDFVVTAGHSYFLQYMMTKFNMKDLADSPTHKLIPENVTQLHAKSKKAIFDGIMDEVIAEIYIPYESQVLTYIWHSF